MSGMKFTLLEFCLIVAASILAAISNSLMVAIACAMVLWIVLSLIERWVRQYPTISRQTHKQ